MDFSTIKALSIPEGVVVKIEIAGNVIWQAITATYKNWVKYAIDTDGNIYNGGLGYRDGYRVSSSGSIKASDDPKGICTGYIPLTGGDVIRVAGVEWAAGESHAQKAIAFFDSSFNWLGTVTNQSSGGLFYGICNSSNLKFSEADGITTFQTPTNTSIAYVVISAVNTGNDMIVTINEEIREMTLESISVTYIGGDVSVGTNLSDLAGITVIAHYSDGSTLDVTDYTLSGEIIEGTNVITVSYEGFTASFTVTGIALQTYTNLVPTSTDTDGSVYNGTGYKNNVRLSSSGSVSGSAQNGSVTTGFMPWQSKGIIRLKGATFTQTSGEHYYIHFYDENKNFLYGGDDDAYFTNANYSNYFSHSYDEATGVTTLDFTRFPTTLDGIYNAVTNGKFFRLNAKGSGANLVVTVNEEIA